MNKTLLKLKIKDHVYEITSKDVFLKNGLCVQLVSQGKSKCGRFDPILDAEDIQELSNFKIVADLDWFSPELIHMHAFNLIEKDKTEFQSNAQWPPGVCSSMYGDDISTDKHSTYEMAQNVCIGLKAEGFGGDGKEFPVKVWVS